MKTLQATAGAMALAIPLFAFVQAPATDPAASAQAAPPLRFQSDLQTALTGRSSSGPVYRSVFDGYRGFTDQPVLSWRESNDLVGRIGGWQAYAREAQGAPAAAPSPGTPAAAPRMPGMPAGHGGHGGMTMPPAVSDTPATPGDHSGTRKP